MSAIRYTYSAFVQGVMPSEARPEFDTLEGLTAAIVVGQERLGGDARSTVGTAIDATPMLRILYSRIGDPQVGPSSAFSPNVPSITAYGAITVVVVARRSR